MPNGRMIVKDQLKRLWKEMTINYFRTPSQHLPVGTGKSHRLI